MSSSALIQTILFDNTLWNIKQARTWLRNHGMKYRDPVDETSHFLRFRQMDPLPGWKYFTKVLKGVDLGVEVVLTHP
jgi:hypothetical protein